MSILPFRNNVVGIRALFMFRPETGRPMLRLAHELLHGESPLTKGERELIAAFVSYGNKCEFCFRSHRAAARVHFREQRDIVDRVIVHKDYSDISPKMSALLTIADMVRLGGRRVTDDHVARARSFGAVDKDIHDTVLIAAAFSMFNRYVEALRPPLPQTEAEYEAMGERMALQGYVEVDNASH